MKQFAVIGNPVAHSKSPQIHAAFARQCGIELGYQRILADATSFADQVSAFFASGGSGLNVTLPFKEAAFALAEVLGPEAEAAGAVNTLMLDPMGRLRGDNTDGIGLVRDLADNLAIPLAGQRLLVIGAGGAVRGILPALLAAEPRELLLVNRTRSRADVLVERFATSGRLRSGDFADLAGEQFDLLIQGSSAAFSGEGLDLPVGLVAGSSVYDLIYGDKAAPFLRWARACGARLVADGLGMLVEQAAESFYLWHGVRPQTAPVIAQLRQATRV